MACVELTATTQSLHWLQSRENRTKTLSSNSSGRTEGSLELDLWSRWSEHTNELSLWSSGIWAQSSHEEGWSVISFCFTCHYDYDHDCHVEAPIDQQFHAMIILDANQLMLIIFGLALKIKSKAHSVQKMCLLQPEWSHLRKYYIRLLNYTASFEGLNAS